LLLDFLSGSLDSRITFTRASTATFFNSSGTLTSASNDVARFDYNPATLAPLGLLIEESRTNSIRNNTMQGAAAGTPGTNPTNWAVSLTANGITQAVSAVGTENGIAYVDIRYNGTPTAGTNVAIAFEGTNNVAASSGQTWTENVYVKLQAGSFTGTTTIISLLGTNGTSGTESIDSAVITSTPADLRNCRLSVSGTFANAGTTNAQPRIRIGYTVGVAIDITLRIGLPQLEQGAFATSVIPTTTTALTRAADVASVNTLSPWYNAVEGTIYVEGVGVNNVTGGATRRYAEINNGTSAERFLIGYASTAATRFQISDNSVSQADIGVAVTTGGATVKIAATYTANDFQQASNGVLGTAVTSGTLPTVTKLALGSDGVPTTNTSLNGYLRRVSFFPRRLADAELQAITL
jgi:hypothetical protein